MYRLEDKFKFPLKRKNVNTCFDEITFVIIKNVTFLPFSSLFGFLFSFSFALREI